MWKTQAGLCEMCRWSSLGPCPPGTPEAAGSWVEDEPGLECSGAQGRKRLAFDLGLRAFGWRAEAVWFVAIWSIGCVVAVLMFEERMNKCFVQRQQGWLVVRKQTGCLVG